MKKNIISKGLKILAIILVFAIYMVFTFKLIAPWVSSPDTYDKTITFIDENKKTVMRITAASTVASLAVSALPDDTATPIANKLADISGYMFVVMCVLYLEKYLLTTIGFISVGILLPIGVLLLLLSFLLNTAKEKIRSLGIRFMVVAVIFTLLIPSSVAISNKVSETYKSQIDSIVSKTGDYADEIEQEKNKSAFSFISDKLNDLKEKATSLLNQFIESVAVMLVITCLIPILTVIIFFWIIKNVLLIPVPQVKIPKGSDVFNKIKGKDSDED